MALCPGLPRWASTRKEKPTWILLKQETVSGSGTSWAICKSAPRSRQITMPAPHHSVFYRPNALPATQPMASRVKALKANKWIKWEIIRNHLKISLAYSLQSQSCLSHKLSWLTRSGHYRGLYQSWKLLKNSRNHMTGRLSHSNCKSIEIKSFIKYYRCIRY